MLTTHNSLAAPIHGWPGNTKENQNNTRLCVPVASARPVNFTWWWQGTGTRAIETPAWLIVRVANIKLSLVSL